MSDYQLLCGDAVQVLKTLPSGSVQCCVTSPPYYGLRSYLPDGHPDKEHELGAEDTPEAYVSRMVEVFREVRRVLHPSGVCFVNIGDSYYNYRPGNYDDNRAHAFGGERDNFRGMPSSSSKRGNRLDGLKEKDLIGIPWMTAFALRADGWWLRQEIIWHKLAPMPESVTDRCTKAHEQVFLLAKSREYFFDAEAIREPLTTPIHKPGNNFHPDKVRGPNDRGGHSQWDDTKERAWGNPAGRNKRSVWTLGPEQYSGSHYAVMPTKLVEPCVLAGSKAGDTVLDPFFGSGTVGAVALKHGRRFVGIDLDERNLDLAHKRIGQSQPMLLDITT